MFIIPLLVILLTFITAKDTKELQGRKEWVDFYRDRKAEFASILLKLKSCQEWHDFIPDMLKIKKHAYC